MSVPPTGPGGAPPPAPKGPTGPPSKQSSDWVLTSPWAKMFTAVGMTPTAKELHQIIANLLKQELQTIKKDQERMKKAMRKMKERMEGNE